MMPAINSAPTDVLVATAYITITIDGGIRIPSAPEVVITPAPKRFGKPCATIAGRMIDPIATTVAGELPDTAANSAQAMPPARAGGPREGSMTDRIAPRVAGERPDTPANSAQAMTPASARPPCQCPTQADAKSIIRRATPPCVRKLPARMKNGIAMISNFSIPVKSFSATDWIGTEVIVNRYVSTVRPSEIEIGIPVRLRPNRHAQMIQ